MLGNYSLRLCTMLFNKPDPVIYLRLSISRFAMAYSITCHADARARMPAINRGTCSCMHTMPFRLLDARSYRETRTDLTSLYNDFVFSIFFPSFFLPPKNSAPIDSIRPAEKMTRFLYTIATYDEAKNSIFDIISLFCNCRNKYSVICTTLELIRVRKRIRDPSIDPSISEKKPII